MRGPCPIPSTARCVTTPAHPSPAAPPGSTQDAAAALPARQRVTQGPVAVAAVDVMSDAMTPTH